MRQINLTSSPWFWLTAILGVAFAQYAPEFTLCALVVLGPTAILIAVGEYFTWR